MTLNFIYILIPFLYILLLVAIVRKDISIAAIVGFGLLASGVYMLSFGIGGVSDFFVLVISTINICVGGYITIVGALEIIEATF